MASPRASATYKPLGYHSLSPYLIVENADRVITFIQKVLGGTVLYRVQDNDGRVSHAEIKIDDSVLMLGESISPSEPSSASLHLYVPNVDETYSAALEAGGTSLQEPTAGGDDDTDRRAGVKGPGGTTWWFSTQQQDRTSE